MVEIREKSDDMRASARVSVLVVRSGEISSTPIMLVAALWASAAVMRASAAVPVRGVCCCGVSSTPTMLVAAMLAGAIVSVRVICGGG